MRIFLYQNPGRFSNFSPSLLIRPTFLIFLKFFYEAALLPFIILAYLFSFVEERKYVFRSNKKGVN